MTGCSFFLLCSLGRTGKCVQRLRSLVETCTPRRLARDLARPTAQKKNRNGSRAEDRAAVAGHLCLSESTASSTASFSSPPFLPSCLLYVRSMAASFIGCVSVSPAAWPCIDPVARPDAHPPPSALRSLLALLDRAIITLTSVSDIRYVGRLHSIDHQESTISLENGTSRTMCRRAPGRVGGADDLCPSFSSPPASFVSRHRESQAARPVCAAERSRL